MKDIVASASLLSMVLIVLFFFFRFYLLFIYFIYFWLCRVLVAVHGLFVVAHGLLSSYGMWVFLFFSCGTQFPGVVARGLCSLRHMGSS